MGKPTHIEIVKEIAAAQDLINEFADEVRDKEMIVIVGNSRSGKSTIANYLKGNELEAIYQEKRYLISLKRSVSGPLIQHGSISCTLYPEICQNNENPCILYVDMPGFEDFRSEVQNTITTIFANQLRFARSVKFVLVCDIIDILSDNVRNFTSALTKMECVVPSYDNIKNSLSVIFTKDRYGYTKEDVAGILQRKILHVIGIDIKKNLLNHIVKHPELIGIFRMPSKSGALDRSEVDCNIKGAISNSNPMSRNVQSIHLSLPESSHCLLLEKYNDYLTDMDFAEETRKIIVPYKRYFSVDKYVFASTENELSNTKSQLQFIQTRLLSESARTFSNMNNVIESLQSVAQNLNAKFHNKLEFFKLMENLSLLDRNIGETVVKNYITELTKLAREVDKLISKISSEQTCRTEETVQYIVSKATDGLCNLKVMSTMLIPLAKNALETAGFDVSLFTFEVAEIGCATWCLAGASLIGGGLTAYGMHYYNTVYLRNKYRKEQGR